MRVNNQQSYCEHNFGQRYLRGTWTTAELHYATIHGYKIIEIFEVWHWNEKRRGLFSDYVDTFMKIKIESSGWPNNCVDDVSKDAFVRQVRETEDIELDKTKVNRNPGWRKIAKDMLNNFWGKYGQSDEVSRTAFIHDPKKFYEKVRSKADKITDIDLVTEHCVMVTSAVESEYNEGNPCGNLAIAAFTTSWARLRLGDAKAIGSASFVLRYGLGNLHFTSWRLGA